MRDWGPLTAALVLTVLAHFGLPLTPTDPLRSTLVLLPLMVTGLLGIGRWAQERGGETTPSPVAAVEASLFMLLIVLALSRHHFGLGPVELLDRCIAGGFAALLTHRLWWLVRALRHTLGEELPRFAPAPFLALPFIVYLAILPWTTMQRPPDGDAPHYLLLTHSLAYDFDTDLRNNYTQGDSLRFIDQRLEPQPGDPQGAQGELYSRHNMLMPLLLAPFYRLGGVLGVLIVMAGITAATCWLTLALARCYDAALPREAVLAWAALAFTAPFLLFSYQVWVEIPAAFLVLVALIQIHRLRREDHVSSWQWVILYGSVLLLPLLKIRFLLISVPLAALALWQGTRRSRIGAAILLAALAMLTAGTLLFNQWVFQNPLKYHDIDGLKSYSQPIGQYLRGFAGLFFDCAFGLFANAPIWMLLIPALIVVARRRHQALTDFGLVFLPYLIILLPRGEWFGAWSPPYRYGVVMLPVLTLWLIPLLRQGSRRGGRQLVIVSLLVATFALTTLWLVVPGWTYNLAHGRSHLLDLLSTQVAADVARFFPSSTRIRTATFAWPPVAIGVMTLLWMRWRRESRNFLVPIGVAVALLTPALLVWSSQHRATRVVEFEDPWLGLEEGSVYPDLWVIYRPQFRGGWRLPAGASIQLPAVAGGKSLELQIEVLVRPESAVVGVLEIRDEKGRTLDRSAVDRAGEWTSLRFEDLPWNAGEPLTLTFLRPDGSGRNHQTAILDRATLTWRDR